MELTSEEASALDAAIRASGSETAIDPAQDVTPYDLTGSRHVSRALPSLSVLDDRTATLLGREFSRSLRADFTASVRSSGVTRADVFLQSLASPGCYIVVELEGLGGQGVLSIQPSLIFEVLERLFGRKGASPFEESEPRDRVSFSAIEHTVIKRIVGLFGRAMEDAWCAQVPFRLEHERTEVKPANIGVLKAGDNLVATTFELKSDGLVGEVHFAMPMSALDAHKEELGELGERSSELDAEWRGKHERAIRGVRVDVSAQLGRAMIPLKRLLGLQPGDVIRLDQAPEDPVVVHVAGLPRFVGRPSVRYGDIAVEIDGPYQTCPKTSTKRSE